MAKLTRQQQRDLEILHSLFLTSVTAGQTSQEEVDDWCASVKLWYIVAAKLGKHVAAMQDQAKRAESMCLQAETGLLTLTHSDFENLKTAVVNMRTLAKLTSAELASWAADQAEVQTNKFLKEIAYRN